jgi:hypothetical protein
MTLFSRFSLDRWAHECIPAHDGAQARGYGIRVRFFVFAWRRAQTERERTPGHRNERKASTDARAPCIEALSL